MVEAAGIPPPSVGAIRVFQPLIGDDIYVAIEDVRIYLAALTSFWKELPVALEQAGGTD